MKTEHKFYLGKCDYNGSGRKNCKAYVTWNLEGGGFTMCAEIWNPSETDCYIGGQCVDTVARFFRGNAKLKRMLEIWKAWHLNDMKAGLPAQEAAIAAWTASGAVYEYSAACDMLKLAGLYEIPLPEGTECTGSFPAEVLSGERGYRYGERWVHQPLPAEVVAEIRSWSNEPAIT